MQIGFFDFGGSVMLPPPADGSRRLINTWELPIYYAPPGIGAPEQGYGINFDPFKSDVYHVGKSLQTAWLGHLEVSAQSMKDIC